jgi:hypothetical protein
LLIVHGPIKIKQRVWVLHPSIPKKVVAEAMAGVNANSKSVNGLADHCHEGSQMIQIYRLFVTGVSVYFPKNLRWPQEVETLDQAFSTTGMWIKWACTHLVHVPDVKDILTPLDKYGSPSIGKENVPGSSKQKNVMPLKYTSGGAQSKQQQDYGNKNNAGRGAQTSTRQANATLLTRTSGARNISSTGRPPLSSQRKQG